MEISREMVLPPHPPPSISPAHLGNFINRLESRPKPQLCHEFGGGSPCTRCDCPGLDLHFWRKICKICSCRLDEHDLVPASENQDHGVLMTRKLFSQTRWSCASESGNSTASSAASMADRNSPAEQLLIGRLTMGKEERRQTTMEGREGGGNGIGIKLMDRVPIHPSQPPSSPHSPPPPPPPAIIDFTAPIHVIYENTAQIMEEGPHKFGQSRKDWAWTPAGDWRLARRYLMSLEGEERPLRGTEGAQLRRQRLAQQLPYHDSDVAASRANKGEEEQKMHREFIELVKREVVGIAEVVDYAQHKAQFATPSPAEHASKCRQCSSKFGQDDVGIVTDHERDKVEAIWHPRCFSCSVCRQLLVDLLYFYRDGKYYCGRHFGEVCYPRCAGCDELIFSREYTFAEEKSWHVEHFCCFGCDGHLSGKRYVVKEEQPFCVDCYMDKFARTCQTCANKIAPFDQRVTYGNLHWHAKPDCFRCKCCAKALSNQQFLLKDDQPFCSGECKVRFGF